MLESAIEIAEKSAVGLLITGKEGLSRYANAAFLELLDLSLDRVLDRSPVEYAPVPSREAFAERLRGAGDPFETQGVGNSGRQVHVLVRPTPVFAPDGHLQGVISFVTSAAPEARRAGAEAEALFRSLLEREQSACAELPAARLPRDVWKVLSPREREISGLLMQGQRPSEIARALHVSVHTVRNHLRLVYRKLDVHSQVELLARLREAS